MWCDTKADASDVWCNRHVMGGLIVGVLPRLSDVELNMTQSVNNTSNISVKYHRCGLIQEQHEYTVQAGFGWTNGVML
ncbi:glycoside hydrolase family 37 protein [Wolfiporia cocos MD-104 SS10]|uniref:Glycoside hydrolase family 37 protein n=1 Tax=Wolfiporia cocos (strain MD-104) TaxID=742152 RepID=A0A2H3JW92_WOLCO|nr:glycoside hydrolase family 37 protein [Wolfiporia cocos MD-104 SS10]